MQILKSEIIETNENYIVKKEVWKSCKSDKGTDMVACYSHDGGYIGDLDSVEVLNKYGIKPQRRNESCSTCSIGFSEKEQKWFGWSHRAIYGFGIGDVVKKGSCCASSGWTDEYLKEHPEKDVSLPVGFKAETLEDAKKMAIAFAECVS